MNKRQIKRRIESAIRRYASAQSVDAYNLVPGSLTRGKLYEAQVLSEVLKELHTQEHLLITLINQDFVTLQSSPGGINRRAPHFDLHNGSRKIAEVWTDIEFRTLSHHSRVSSSRPIYGDLHELDIVVVEPNLTGYPQHDQIWLGVECKNTDYTKNLLREVLGVRRELSFLQSSVPTKFARWPRTSVPARPPSCLLVYSTDPRITNYSAPGQTFGIDFYHHPL